MNIYKTDLWIVSMNKDGRMINKSSAQKYLSALIVYILVINFYTSLQWLEIITTEVGLSVAGK